MKCDVCGIHEAKMSVTISENGKSKRLECCDYCDKINNYGDPELIVEFVSDPAPPDEGSK